MREQVITSYTPEYCAYLEAAYGKGMLSPGGAGGIEAMFEGIELKNRRALDIGSGLGQVAFYLADAHAMQVVGLDINPWLVEEATARIPTHLRDRVTFDCAFENGPIDLPDGSLDLIYSKGVLCHLQERRELLAECWRVLKPGGELVISEWVSTVQGDWGARLQEKVKLDRLSLAPDTEESYLHALHESGFEKVAVREYTQLSRHYNQEIVDRHMTPEFRTAMSARFGELTYFGFLQGYAAIVCAYDVGELRALRFTTRKE